MHVHVCVRACKRWQSQQVVDPIPRGTLVDVDNAGASEYVVKARLVETSRLVDAFAAVQVPWIFPSCWQIYLSLSRRHYIELAVLALVILHLWDVRCKSHFHNVPSLVFSSGFTVLPPLSSFDGGFVSMFAHGGGWWSLLISWLRAYVVE